MSATARTFDASRLPENVLDSRSLVWWGTVVMTVIEGMVFAVAVAAYFYLRALATVWPPPRTGPESPSAGAARRSSGSWPTTCGATAAE